MAHVNERAWLKCTILSETEKDRTIRAQVIDGQNFEIVVPYWSVTPIEGVMNEGWVEVELLGELKIDGKCSIKLPGASIQFGDKINVKTSQLKKT